MDFAHLKPKKNVPSYADFEKPTAQVYYLKLSTVNSQLLRFTWTVMRDKMRLLKSKYRSAIDWRNNTGQGIDGEDKERTIREYILKLCPHFDELDEIFASRPSFNPLFVFDSDHPSQEVVEEVVIDDMADEMGSSNESALPEFEFEERTSPFDMTEDTCPSFSHFKAQLAKKPKEKGKKAPTSSVAQLAQITRDRLAHEANKLAAQKEGELKKIELEREKFEWQKKRDLIDQEIQRKKVETEQQRMREEMMLKELQVKTDIRLKEEAQKNNFILEKMKLEKEMLAIRLEMDKNKK
ncbi:hypothetical protein GE061_015330 [Apolygus lucorum]|uniref:Uncharacterized protein n=1 Tax=Apolygus lucorum TaxID=248454 RepID=A0A8S9XKN7_APOLU|nr:hypothetical protein GE061_015330 [Apolygus lucorum]